MDLAVANHNASSISVLLGNGYGTFQTAQNFTVGYNPAYVAVFNGNGRPDLAVANYRFNTVSVLPGNGDGTFQAPLSFAVGTGPTSIGVGDLNGDGQQDLAITNYDETTVTLLLSKGSSAVTLSSLILNPATVTGGNSSVGTVTLSAPAPSGGAVVSLSSSNPPVASVPASVTVPAGATSASFTATTTAATISTPVPISASYNRSTPAASP